MTQPRFLVDAQLPPALASRLTDAGYAAQHVTRLGLGEASDGEIWARAAADGATLITKDEDFAALAFRTRNGPAVVWIRLGNTTNAALWAALEPRLPEILSALRDGERLIEVV